MTWNKITVVHLQITFRSEQKINPLAILRASLTMPIKWSPKNTVLDPCQKKYWVWNASSKSGPIFCCQKLWIVPHHSRWSLLPLDQIKVSGFFYCARQGPQPAGYTRHGQAQPTSSQTCSKLTILELKQIFSQYLNCILLLQLKLVHHFMGTRYFPWMLNHMEAMSSRVIDISSNAGYHRCNYRLNLVTAFWFWKSSLYSQCFY